MAPKNTKRYRLETSAASSSAAESGGGADKKLKTADKILKTADKILKMNIIISIDSILDEFIPVPDVAAIIRSYNSAPIASLVLSPHECIDLRANFKAYAKTLFTDGVVSIPVLDSRALLAFQKLMDSSVASFPEYKNPATADHLVQGGFGAQGNASSFHCPFARRARGYVHWFATALFRELENEIEPASAIQDNKMTHVAGCKCVPTCTYGPLRLEQLMDRLMRRHKSKKPTKESAHRDESPCLCGDMVYGGWLNVTSTSQFFSCVPGSHRSTAEGNNKAGFNKISPDEVKLWKSKMQLIECKPGHWIVFKQDLVHEVNAVAITECSKRIFFGWRLTRHLQPMFDQTDVINEQSRPYIPSGQDPRMYPKLYLSYKKHRDVLEKWSQETFIPEMLEQKTVLSGEMKGSTYTVVKAHCPSLTELKVKLYEPYKQWERDLFTPQLFGMDSNQIATLPIPMPDGTLFDPTINSSSSASSSSAAASA